MKLIAMAFLFTFFSLKSCFSGDKQHKADLEMVKTDAEMISLFKKNKDDFEKLVKYLQEDSISYFYNGNFETIERNDLAFTDKRQAEYTSLFKKLSVKTVARGNALKYNTIVIYTVEKQEGDSVINKGYEYRIDDTRKYADWVETKNSLSETASDYPTGTFITRPIEKHWNLFLLIQ